MRALNMAAICFSSAVDNEKEDNLRLQAVPESTKSATNWEISVWKEWVTTRSVKVDVLSAHPCWQCQLMTSLTGWRSSF